MLETIQRLLKEKKYQELRELLENMNPADAAAEFEELFEEMEGGENLLLLFRLLPKDLAAETFAYMNTEMQKHLLQVFTDREIQEVFENTFMDDTVDIIEEMPANVVKRIIQNSDAESRRIINDILRYPEDSAGSIMTTEYVTLRRDMTTSEAIKRIRRVGVNKETIYTCYVTSDERKLVGMASVRDLLTAPEEALIGDIMETNLISVKTHDDKELVAKMLGKYDFIALPVVDNENRLVGIVTFDDAMDVMQEENTEDFEKMAAVMPSDDSYLHTSVWAHAKKRIPWLLVLMLSSTITGMLITKYENAFAVIPLLVSFIPMLMNTGGNCGSQTSTMVIRGLALDEIEFKDFFKVIFKEVRIALIVGIVLAVVNGVRIYLSYGRDIQLAGVLTGTLICTVIISKMIGCILPMAAKKVHLDPALMAAPLITTIVDSCSVWIYFQIAMRVFDIAV